MREPTPSKAIDEMLRRLKKREATTIKRCAKVARDYRKVCGAHKGSVIDAVIQDIAEAIEALKDKP